MVTVIKPRHMPIAILEIQSHPGTCDNRTRFTPIALSLSLHSLPFASTSVRSQRTRDHLYANNNSSTIGRTGRFNAHADMCVILFTHDAFRPEYSTTANKLTWAPFTEALNNKKTLCVVGKISRLKHCILIGKTPHVLCKHSIVCPSAREKNQRSGSGRPPPPDRTAMVINANYHHHQRCTHT